MTFDEFKTLFVQALRDSGLPMVGRGPNETVDLESMGRAVSVHVTPIDRDIGGPFYVGATLSFRWDALQTARTRTTEDDIVVRLLGEVARDQETERPWLRMDIELNAGLERGKAIPMPPATIWAKWSRETFARLEEIERVVTEDAIREEHDGRHAILSWQGEPELRVTCNPLGELRLEAISLSAFQLIDLPRIWDDGERGDDESPREQLHAMFGRLRAALHAWGEVMDHLRAPSSAQPSR